MSQIGPFSHGLIFALFRIWKCQRINFEKSFRLCFKLLRFFFILKQVKNNFFINSTFKLIYVKPKPLILVIVFTALTLLAAGWLIF